MTNKGSSFISKGWLIIGLVMLIIGSCLLFLANSLYYESDQLESYISNSTSDGNIMKILENIRVYGRFLVITSIITIIIGGIIIIECILFSKFLKRFADK